MEITFFGHSCFRLKGKPAFAGTGLVTVVIDPFDPTALEFKLPKLEADVVITSGSSPVHGFWQAVSGDPYRINQPGEYEVKGASVLCYQASAKGEKVGLAVEEMLNVIELEELRICHLGNISKSLSEELIEAIGSVDILMVPVGGMDTLNPKEAASLAKAIGSAVVIPMLYKEDAEAFIAEIGCSKEVVTGKLTVTKDRLASEMKVVVMERWLS